MQLFTSKQVRPLLVLGAISLLFLQTPQAYDCGGSLLYQVVSASLDGTCNATGYASEISRPWSIDMRITCKDCTGGTLETKIVTLRATGQCTNVPFCGNYFCAPWFTESAGTDATGNWWISTEEDFVAYTAVGTCNWGCSRTALRTKFETCPCVECDNDTDGYGDRLYGGEDCDDENPNIHPNAALSCGGGYEDDFNCNDIHDFLECSPVILDILGNNYNLTDYAGGVDFGFFRADRKIRLPWTAAGSDDAWLVLDRNGNGTIDDSTELFGTRTPQTRIPGVIPNGFIALGEYDRLEAGGNSDGRIDASDFVFVLLRLWQDANHNGVSEPNELFGLPALNVSAIEIDFKESMHYDRHGNLFRYRAKMYNEMGNSRWAYDVLFCCLRQK